MSQAPRGSVTQLLGRAHKGDSDAMAQLWQRHVKLLYAMAQYNTNIDLSLAADERGVIAEEAVYFRQPLSIHQWSICMMGSSETAKFIFKPDAE